MAKYTLAAAAQIAKRIHHAYGDILEQVSRLHDVPAHWLAGLTGMENPQCYEWPDIKSTRFEPSVFNHLMAILSGHEQEYNGVTLGHMRDAATTSEAVKSLARSYGQTQIMGYYLLTLFAPPLQLIRVLNPNPAVVSAGPEEMRTDISCTLAHLSDPRVHYFFTAFFLTNDPLLSKWVGARLVTPLPPAQWTAAAKADRNRVCLYHMAHLWNSGREWDGVDEPEHIHTFSPDYMYNCWLVAQYYLGMMQQSEGESEHLLPATSAAYATTLEPHSGPEAQQPEEKIVQQPQPSRPPLSTGPAMPAPASTQISDPQVSPSLPTVGVREGWKTSEAHLTAAFVLISTVLALFGYHYTPEHIANIYDGITHILSAIGPIVSALFVLWNYTTSRGKLKSNAVNATARLAIYMADVRQED